MPKALRIAGRVVSGIVTVLLLLVLLLNLYRIAAEKVFRVQNPTVFGFSSAVVLTGSMSGAIEPDDWILTRSQDGYAVGDIIMYRSTGSTVTHRIIALESGGYRTKGDANNTADQGKAITQAQIVGKVVAIVPGAGAALRFLRSPLGMLLLLAVGLGLYFLPRLIRKETN